MDIKEKELRHAVIVARFPDDNYRIAVDTILSGERKYASLGVILVAVFKGLTEMGIDQDKQIPFVKQALQGLGIDVSGEETALTG